MEWRINVVKDFLEIQGRSYMTPITIMAEFGITQPTFYRWVKRDLLPKPIKLGTRRYYARDEVEARLARGE
jgi:predicted DNA-binding transcriptional regulator AlpA